jgi:hypothetical protein
VPTCHAKLLFLVFGGGGGRFSDEDEDDDRIRSDKDDDGECVEPTIRPVDIKVVEAVVFRAKVRNNALTVQLVRIIIDGCL